MQNKIKYQRKTDVHQAKKNLWKMMANYRDCILHHPASQVSVYAKRVKDLSFFEHLMLFLMILSRILLLNAPCYVLCLKMYCK